MNKKLVKNNITYFILRNRFYITSSVPLIRFALDFTECVCESQSVHAQEFLIGLINVLSCAAIASLFFLAITWNNYGLIDSQKMFSSSRL